MRHNSESPNYDLAVVGGGILGLAGALAAARQGLKVVIFEKDARALGASVRNFGFVTISGQDPVAIRPRAIRSRQLWLQLAEESGIPLAQRHSLVLAQRPLASSVLHEFKATDRADSCRLLSRAEIRKLLPSISLDHIHDVLYSPHELRVESKEAIPRLCAWLHESFGVTVLSGCNVLAVDRPLLITNRGQFKARRILICPGAHSNGPKGAELRATNITRCKLQMLRLASPGFRFPATIMSDFSLIRYGDFAEQPSANALKTQLSDEHPLLLQNGIHLIVAQGLDGTLVVGDSHHYSNNPDEKSIDAVDQMILEEYQRAIGVAAPQISQRWTGVYPSRSGDPIVIEKPQEGVRVMTVTTGCGASIGLALGEEVITELLSDSDS